jgi:phage I-like protein
MEKRQDFRNTTGGLLPAEVPAEGWYQVDLEGVWNGHPAGAYRLTPADIRGIVEYFNRACRANGVDLPVDYEHQGAVAKLLGKSAESGGWINALEARENDTQLWAHIRWVDDARALIRERKFRYLSSHLMADYKDPVTGQMIPWVLDSVALTNRPFKKELPAVANSDAAASGVDSAVAEEEDGAMNQLLTLLAAAMSLDAKAVANSLGVAEDAPADVVVKAVADRLMALEVAGREQRRTAEAETKILAICNALGATPEEPLAELLARIGAQRANREQSAAERMIENAVSVERKITPANRDRFLALALKDLEGTRAILNSVTNAVPLGERDDATGLSEEDKWACQQHGIQEADFLATKKKLAVA